MNILLAILMIFFIMLPMGYTSNIVKEVAPGSSAEAVGIKVGDKFEKYNGSNLYQMNDLEVLSYPMSINDKIKLQISRNGKSQTIEFTPNRNGGYKLGFLSAANTADGTDSNVVDSVSDKSAAMDAGLKKGDRIVGLNGKAVSSIQDIKNILNEVKGNKVKITVLRDGSKLDLKEVSPTLGKLPEAYAIGVSFESAKGNIASAFVQSIKYNISMSRTIIYSVGWLFQKVVPMSDMMGPVGITSTIKDVVDRSPSFVDKLVNLLSFTSMISINLGLLNLFPFPALDGSKLVLLAVEGIRKKPLAPEKEAFITMVGFVLLIMLMIYATFNDILRIGRG
jgi:regulator of sigma E protease